MRHALFRCCAPLVALLILFCSAAPAQVAWAQEDLGDYVPGEVLVKLNVSGVNPSDVKSRAGRPLAGAKVVPHSDGSGVITAVGDNVPALHIGERVWLWNGQWQRAFGTAAEAKRSTAHSRTVSQRFGWQ